VLDASHLALPRCPSALLCPLTIERIVVDVCVSPAHRRASGRSHDTMWRFQYKFSANGIQMTNDTMALVFAICTLFMKGRNKWDLFLLAGKRTRTALEYGCLTAGHTHTHTIVSRAVERERGACALAWIVYCVIELHSARERPCVCIIICVLHPSDTVPWTT
jgi:hypothetical protein